MKKILITLGLIVAIVALVVPQLNLAVADIGKSNSLCKDPFQTGRNGFKIGHWLFFGDDSKALEWCKERCEGLKLSCAWTKEDHTKCLNGCSYQHELHIGNFSSNSWTNLR